MKIEFETYRDLTNGYMVGTMKQEKPSAINFLSYRKYKVVIELIDEPTDVLIKRLESLLEKTDGYNKKVRIENEIKKLKSK